ncbi:MAG: CotH kinase family protein, partial [Verrucomicrobia bacterium]|nr:CotH kinase family protein [Verrucomicrobiota bacterium]
MLFRLPLLAGPLTALGILFMNGVATNAAPFISEFMADNTATLADQDGDYSDWIEITNPDATPADLAGWRLTDNASQRSKWSFPAGVVVPPGGRLIVFASGKNRAGAGAELHTNFTLKKEGEFLAFYPPTGNKPASVFAPAFPPQYPDVSYGVGFRASLPAFVTNGGPARILVPAAGDAGLRWTGAPADEPFSDVGWIVGTTRAGYDDLSSGGNATLLGYWDFNDASAPGVALDSSPRHSHGAVVSPAAFTADGGGRTGLVGDRAMDFGAGGKNSSVRVDAAGAGAFDLVATLDQLTVSLWAFGGPQLPLANCAFWFDSGLAGVDSRAAMAHLPWSDSVIYFDTAGCCGNDTRISRQELDTTKWRGRWNHYVFLKDGPRKEIWQNGALWHEGSGAIPLKAIKALWLGSAPNGGISYPGKLDDVAVWAGALSSSDIVLLAGGMSPLSVGSYRPYIVTDLGAPMRNISARAWMRASFAFSDILPLDALSLRARYDDGFVAWINGVEVARRNVPVTSRRAKFDGLTPAEMDLGGSIGLLRPGANILAVAGYNDTAAGSDFLLNVELVGGQALPARYFPSPTPMRENNAGVQGFVDSPALSPGRGFFDAPVSVKITSPTLGATLVYTTDGSLPTLSHGWVIRPPDSNTPPSVTVTVTNSGVLRVFAIKEDYAPSEVQTHSYVFAGLVSAQPAKPAGFPATWGVYGAYGPVPGQAVPADYEMDPKITKATTAGYSVKDAILSLPAMCVSMDVSNLFDPVTGIYPNSAAQGGQWVRPASAELIFPDGKPGFQIDAGIRIHGGLSRQHWHAKKHSFRMGFTKEYGPSRLDYRLLDDTRVTTFNELTLRACSTDGWAVEDAEPWTRPKATYMRDVWIKDTAQALGWPCGHSRYVHLFLNGLYWGMYNLAERTEPVWLSQNYGGSPEEWDVIKDVGEVESGNKTAWNEMIAMASAGLATEAAFWRIQGRNPDGTLNSLYPVYLNMDSLIDYMILHIYSGAIDWPNHNWWSGRRRGPASEGFRFFPWDQEISNISLSITTTYTGERFEAVTGPTDSPAFLYAKLRDNPLFQARFSARVLALTTGTGILTPSQNTARWERRRGEIDHAIVAESARWGDSRQTVPLKRSDWLAEMNWMRISYWPLNHDIALNRFRSVGLYGSPATRVLTMTPMGGIVISGSLARITGVAPIYYSTNGENPLTPAGLVAPGGISYTGPVRVAGPMEIRAQRLVNAAPSPPLSGRFLTTAYVAPSNAVVVSEIHYHPARTEDEEFVEVWNSSATQYAPLGGGRLSGGVDFAFTNETV